MKPEAVWLGRALLRASHAVWTTGVIFCEAGDASTRVKLKPVAMRLPVIPLAA